ncbi:Hypothetical Protein FCC1311_037082 [Hondaea fermentalgiana]|uniref:Uncharacterized protein n=1 Tax=Hondaea fermentalgiana TaxID=2315210 RepID=A0A2R5G8U6_9STRA|nr:Hypothetical Protein FCC1311_037082 [Hondaea fermentalgiana]|eukprot:GBG27486.1 Hypothetical Protein FCC1311_037082 [Hondaea fermentalgiana]
MRPATEVAQDVRAFLAELESDDALVAKKLGDRKAKTKKNGARSELHTSYSYGDLKNARPGTAQDSKRRARPPDMKRIETLARPRTGPGSAGFVNQDIKPVKMKCGPSMAWVERRAQPKKPRDRDNYEPIVYLQDRSAWSQPSGGKFNESRPKSWIEWNVYLTKGQPGPAAYAPHLAPNLPKGGKFNAARTPSALDLAIARARDLPGPVSATGQIPSTLEKSGVGRVSMSRGKTYIDWEVIRARDLPGPGEYSADAQHRGGGVRFGNQNPKSELDTIIYNARDLPGPSEYYPERSYIGR